MDIDETAKKRERLMELARGLKQKLSIKARTEEQKLALKLARNSNQVVYGSAASSGYAPGIKPKDLDINTKNPRLAALRLKRELLKKKGISMQVKKKYIEAIKKNIYEVGTVSYSPIDKKIALNSKLRNKLRATNIKKEILALSGTIVNPYSDYRSYKDFMKLKEIQKQLPKKRQEEYKRIIKELEREKLRRKYLYTTKKTERLNKIKVLTLKEKKKKGIL